MSTGTLPWKHCDESISVLPPRCSMLNDLASTRGLVLRQAFCVVGVYEPGPGVSALT